MTTLHEGAKYDADKIRLDLLSPNFLLATAEVLTFGAKKYEEHNWAKGILYSRVYRAAVGHLLDWFSGEENDTETGLSHLAHAACCIMFLIHYTEDEEQYSAFDNRPPWNNMVPA